MKRKISYIGKFILSSIVFFLMGTLVYYVLSKAVPSFKIDFSHLRNYALFDLLTEIIVSILIVAINFKILKENYIKNGNKIKNNFGSYLKIVIINTFAFFAVKYFAGIIETSLCGFFNVKVELAKNQKVINDLFLAAPIFMIISGSVFAPLSEELIFRGALKKVLNKKGIFITVSGLIFGLMHITGSYLLLATIFLIGLVLEMIISSNSKNKKVLSVIAVASLILLFFGIEYLLHGNIIYPFIKITPSELIGSVGYVIPGIYFAYLYTKYDDIFLNMGVHGLNNLFSFLMYMLFL